MASAANELASETKKDVLSLDYFSNVTLRGARVDLLPMSRPHGPDLENAGADDAIWRWLPSVHSAPGSMMSFIESAIALRERRLIVPFTIFERTAGKSVGATRFHFVEPEQRRLEIGVTWLGCAFQRSHVNTETKFLQLWYAFDVLGCRRVEWKVDAENLKSRAAVLRLGAKEEGLFRKHMIYPDGRNRDSVYFSLIDDEWPKAKADLREKLGYDVAPSYTVEKNAG